MAQKVQVLLVDDLDGGEAEETVSFGVDGAAYEIDLSGNNASKLRDALAPFVEAARKAPAKGGRGSARAQRNAPSRERSAEIRAWAKAAGKQVNERGRIPAAIVAEFKAAQG
ncbi:Lsr2 family protein [Nocardiopsis mangrovi]|uniref:Lsr2 family protein n=1 Tax=Nocardiopsis mangrovi TaxID=1179818 RepID=A0ABV9E115_9ACTN